MKVNNKGFSTLLALGIIAVVFLLVLSGLMMVTLAGQLFTRQLRYQGQAQNTAEAGLVDALNYFRRAGNGAPVTTFDPVEDPLLIPPVDDSDEPAIGIVRTFSVSTLGQVCGRYEVRRQDLNDNGTIESSEVGTGVEDITNEKARRSAGAGNVWLLESHGYIFVDNDDDPGNCDFTPGTVDSGFLDTVVANGVWDPGEKGKVLVRRTLRTQIQRMSLVLPGGSAAVNSARGDAVDIGSVGDEARVLGSTGIAIAYEQSTGSPFIDIDSDVQGGGGATVPLATYNDSILDVFGVTQSELIASADDSPINISTLPLTWTMKLYVIEGNADFTTGRPLIGSGVLVVLGNITVPAGSSFQGIIYTTGNYTQEGPSLVSGSVIVLGNFDLNGTGDFGEIDYDDDMRQQVQAELIQYRFGRNPYLYDTLTQRAKFN